MTVTVFGYLILISIDFYDLNCPFSPSIEERQCLTTFPNTSKFLKNTPLRVLFSTLFSVFGNVVKHGLSCLICYIKQGFKRSSYFQTPRRELKIRRSAGKFWRALRNEINYRKFQIVILLQTDGISGNFSSFSKLNPISSVTSEMLKCTSL